MQALELVTARILDPVPAVLDAMTTGLSSAASRDDMVESPYLKLVRRLLPPVTARAPGRCVRSHCVAGFMTRRGVGTQRSARHAEPDSKGDLRGCVHPGGGGVLQAAEQRRASVHVRFEWI